MTRDELSLLLYLETRAVDYGGRVDMWKMKADDMAILKRWNDSGFLQSGRIVISDINQDGTLWCLLSDDAFALAHQERRARAARMWAKRTFTTTAEKKGQG